LIKIKKKKNLKRLIKNAIVAKDDDYFNKRMELIKKTFNIIFKVQKEIKNKF
jgi:hypothetical protein